MTTPRFIFTVRMTPELRAELEALAAKKGESLNNLITQAVHEMIERHHAATDSYLTFERRGVQFGDHNTQTNTFS